MLNLNLKRIKITKSKDLQILIIVIHRKTTGTDFFCPVALFYISLYDDSYIIMKWLNIKLIYAFF